MSRLIQRDGKTIILDSQDEPVLQIAHGTPTAIASLTHSVGTGNNALVDVGAAFNQGTLNDNFRDLSDKINALLAELRAIGLIS